MGDSDISHKGERKRLVINISGYRCSKLNEIKKQKTAPGKPRAPLQCIT